MATSKSWLSVPESIRIIFDIFPLQLNPAASIPPSVVSPWNEQSTNPSANTANTVNTRKIILHVYNIDAKDNLATDPEGLEIQGLLKLKGLNQHSQIKVVSVHSSPQQQSGPAKATSKLPYLIDVGKNKKRTVYSSVASVRTNLLAPVQGVPTIHRALVSSALRDAWLVTVLLNDELRQLVFGEGPFRIQKVPKVAEQFLQDSWTCQVVEELRPRYPAIIDSVVSRSRIGGGLYHLVKSQWSSDSSSPIVDFFRGTIQGQGIIEEILARARECLMVFETLLENSEYLGVGLDDGQANEDVATSGLGPLDILLFSYIYAIQNRHPNDTELGAIVNEYPLVVAHSQRVYRELFS